MTATILLLLEGSSVFATIALMLSAWARLAPADGALGSAGRALLFSLCCLGALCYNGVYNLANVRTLGELRPRLLRSIPLMLLLLALVYTVLPQRKIPPAALVCGVAAACALLYALRAFFYALLRRPPFLKRVVILGSGPLVAKLVREIELHPACNYAIAGIVDDALSLAPITLHRSLRRMMERIGYPCMGPLKHLRRIVEEVRPDRIIVAPSDGLDRSFVRHALLEARTQGVVIDDGAEVYERLTGKVPIEWLTPQSLVFSKNFRRSGVDQWLARVISLFVAALGLIILTPLFAAIALAIKLDSPGPALFVQERIGRRGKRFRLLKFRTMRPTSRKTSEWAQDNADRITRVGKWLRKFRLDELPQFINVFRGDMNLIGPRPHPASNFELFVLVARNAPECGQPIPYYALRSMVRPGITGWAQIRYRYANGLEEEIEKMRYDLYYIKHMSFWFDLRIFSQTIKVVLFGQESRSEPLLESITAGHSEARWETAA